MSGEYVKYPRMEYCSVKRPQSATAFPKPDDSVCSGDVSEQALNFAAWELRLYLDTHPCDERAFAAYKQLCASAKNKCNYACHTEAGHDSGIKGGCACGDGAHADGRVWHWIDDPWPWELSANMKGGCC